MSLGGEWVGMSVADWTGTLIAWQAALKELREIIAPAFGRREQQQSANAFIALAATVIRLR